MNDIVNLSQEIIGSIDVLKHDIEGLQVSFQKFLAAFIPEEEPSDDEIKVIDEAENDLSKGEYIGLNDFLKDLK